VRRVEGIHFFEVIEGFAAKEWMWESSLRLRVGGSSGRIGSLQLSKKSSRGIVLEELEEGVAKVFCRRTSPVREHFVRLTEVTKEEIDGRSSLWRIHEVPEVIRSCIGVRKLQKHSSSVKLGRNQLLDHSWNQVLGIHELKGQSICIKTRVVMRCEVSR
jgi:hypothetical protein